MKSSENNILDCDTEKGLIFINHQLSVQEYIKSKNRIVIELSHKTSKSDILIGQNIGGRTILTGIAEIKAREKAGNSVLNHDYIKKHGYLITNEKIEYGISLSKSLMVSFYVIVKIITENKLLIWKITDSYGNKQFNYEVKKTETQETVNGGSVFRLNAYLPEKYSKSYKISY